MDENTEGIINLEPKERPVDTREAFVPNCIVFSKTEMRDNFDNALMTINKDLSKAKTLETNGDIELAQDIYRYIIASLESALDYLTHCVLKYGMQMIFLQNNASTKHYDTFPIPLSIVHNMLADPSNPNILINYINGRTSAETYLNYDKFKDTISIIDEGLLDKIVSDLYLSKHDGLKDFLNHLYKRRNLIVHQDDRENINGEKMNISFKEVVESRDEMVRLVDAIFKYLN